MPIESRENLFLSLNWISRIQCSLCVISRFFFLSKTIFGFIFFIPDFYHQNKSENKDKSCHEKTTKYEILSK